MYISLNNKILERDEKESYIYPGQNIHLRFHETIGYITIEVKCFKTQPPPPRFEPCINSGTYTLSENELQHFIFPTGNINYRNREIHFSIHDFKDQIKLKVKFNNNR